MGYDLSASIAFSVWKLHLASPQMGLVAVVQELQEVLGILHIARVVFRVGSFHLRWKIPIQEIEYYYLINFVSTLYGFDEFKVNIVRIKQACFSSPRASILGGWREVKTLQPQPKRSGGLVWQQRRMSSLRWNGGSGEHQLIDHLGFTFMS